MEEKQLIERATAEKFLQLFNQEFGVDYAIVELANSPDVKCRDSVGTSLNLEITLTEDRPGDLQASLGRSNSRSVENRNSARASSLRDNVLEQAKGRIKTKLCNSYGSNTALIVRDTSGVDWDWDFVIDDLKSELESVQNQFDRGVWILGQFGTKLYRIT